MTQDWRDGPPLNIPGFEVGDILRAFSDRTVFQARRGAEEFGAVLCWVFNQEAASPDRRIERFLEASFLSHPNLLRVFAAGVTGGRVYTITEPFDTTLIDAEPLYAPDPGNLDLIVAPVCMALSWLHSQNLVYCALKEEFIVRDGGLRDAGLRDAGSLWKLADFSELRVIGPTAPEETRRLLIRSDLYVPPEAYEGLVSPAWDAWSIGVLIQKLCEASAVGRNQGAVPPDVADLISELADPDPLQRPTVADAARRLSPLRRRAASAPLSSERTVVPAPARIVAEAAETVAEAAERNEAPPARTYSKERVRIAAAVALVLGAASILAAVYAHPDAENRKSLSAIHAASRGREPGFNAGDTVASSRAINPTSGMDEKRRISALLDRWVKSTRESDAVAQSDCYAPMVRQYFGRRDVFQDAIRRAKQRAFERVGPAREFSISNVRFERLTPDQAVVSFLKTWDFPKKHFAGSIWEEMALNRVDDAWKIASERELNESAPPSRASRLPGPDTTDPDPILSGEAERSTHAFAGNW